MPTTRLHQRYVSEVTWLPSYVGIATVVLGSIDNSTLASVALVIALISFRVVLELVYRLTFGNVRLEARTQATAFALQVVVWGLVWAWYAHQAIPA